MAKKNIFPARVGEKFRKELNEIKIKRRMTVDRELPREISNERLTNGIVNLPQWREIKIILERMPRMEDLR